MRSRLLKISYGSVAILAFFVLSASFTPQRAQAYWSDAIPAAFIKQALEEAYDQIQGAILGAQKALSVQILYEQVVNTIAGNGGEALYVTNINDFLSIQPEEEAQLILNDFLSTATSGRNTCSYVNTSTSSTNSSGNLGSGGSVCNSSDGLNFSRSYLQDMADSARTYVLGEVDKQGREVLDEACPKDIGNDMFSDGNLRCFNTLLANNAWEFNVEAQQKYDEEKKKLEEQNTAQFIAYQGYLPKTTSGSSTSSDSNSSSGGSAGDWNFQYRGASRTDQLVITPGSLIKDINAQVNNIGTLFAAGTSNPAEFLGYMAGAYVNRMIMNTIENGVGEIKSAINREVTQVEQNIQEVTNEIEEELGPVVNVELPKV